MDNLVIIYENLADNATITASSTSGGSVASNMKNNTKSKVWRSTATTITLLVTFSSNYKVGGVALPFCNLTSTATIRVRGYSSNPTLSGTSIVGGVQVWDSGVINACPWLSSLHSNVTTAPSGVSSYAYGGGTCARCYTDNSVAVSGITIEIVDSSNTSGYVEISRLVVGDYWSPRFNTSYGLSIEPIDLSQHERTDSGDLITTIGTKHNKLSFDLKYMVEEDRQNLLKILRGNGLTKPMFISLFPYAVNAPYKERDHQIFGKLSELSAITHPTLSIYSSQVTVEEI